ncbi:hypothetical protein MRX96_046891 [Rhipicephalus microplus]
MRCRAHVSTGSRHARWVERCPANRRQRQCNTASTPARTRRCRQELGAQRRAEKEASGSQPGGEEEVLLSLRIRTVRSAFNWAHSGVRSPATRLAGGGARGPGVGNSRALAPLLSEAAVRVSPRSTTPERRHPVQWDGTRALDIEGACPRGQAGAYQSGSLLPPRRRCGRWNE